MSVHVQNGTEDLVSVIVLSSFIGINLLVNDNI